LTNWRQRLLAREGCMGLMAVCQPAAVVSSKLVGRSVSGRVDTRR
jgi:hypothetical protein